MWVWKTTKNKKPDDDSVSLWWREWKRMKKSIFFFFSFFHHLIRSFYDQNFVMYILSESQNIISCKSKPPTFPFPSLPYEKKSYFSHPKKKKTLRNRKFFVDFNYIHNDDSPRSHQCRSHRSKTFASSIPLLCSFHGLVYCFGCVSKFSGAWKSIQDFFLLLFLLLSCFRLSSAGCCFFFSVKYCLMFMRKLCRVIFFFFTFLFLLLLLLLFDIFLFLLKRMGWNFF